MAWNNAVVTNSGVALLQQVLAGGTLTIDGAAGGTGTVLPGVLMAQTSLKNQKQAFSVVGATNVTNGKKVNILVSNADLSTGYTMQQVGIWAHVGEGSSVLFAILQDDTGIAIPSESDIPDFALNFYAVVDFSNESDFALAVDPSALVSFGMLTEAVSDAINEAKGYTDSVVATIDISSKLDKTGNGSDVTAAFTQAETRTNIATGEKLSVLFGKIKKWFADLGSAAFKDVGVVGGVAGHDALTSHKAECAVLIPKSGSTANDILLDIVLTDKKKGSFRATTNNTGDMTINGKALKKDASTQIPADGVKAGRVYDFYYDETADCVFILAKASGTAQPSDVLAGKTFSNDDGEQIGTKDLSGLVPEVLLEGVTIDGVAGTLKARKFATGKATPNASYALIVSGLNFKPTCILAVMNTNGIAVVDYAESIDALGSRHSLQYYGYTPFSTSGGYVNETGFKLPTGFILEYNWVAYA